MKFKIGDKVKIKSWDKIVKLGHPIEGIKGRIWFENTDNIIFNENMCQYCGKEFLIEEPLNYFLVNFYYLIGIPHTWVENWLKEVI